MKYVQGCSGCHGSSNMSTRCSGVFTPFSSVSIVKFGRVNVSWEAFS